MCGVLMFLSSFPGLVPKCCVELCVNEVSTFLFRTGLREVSTFLFRTSLREILGLPMRVRYKYVEYELSVFTPILESSGRTGASSPKDHCHLMMELSGNAPF